MLQNDSTNFIVFQDENIIIDDLRTVDGVYVISAHFKEIPNDVFCTKCWGNNFILHGYYNRTLKHLSILGKNSIVTIKQPRLICKYCKNTFNYTSSEFEKGRRITSSVSQSIIDDIARKQSTKDVAKINNVCEKVVNNELRTHLHDYRCNLSEVVCIDEIDTSIGEDKYSFVIGDPINSIILDILPSRKQDYLIYYFQTLSPENKANVKYIISDLYGPYKLFLQATFPNAIHIADRFHYLNVVKKALEKTRIRIMKKYEQYKGCWKTDPENYNKYYVLKHYGDLLFINPFSDLNKYTLSELIYDKGNKNVTKQKKIEEMVNIDPILEESYLLLKNFYHLDRFSTIKDIHDKLLNWIKSVYDSIYDIKEMKSAASTISDWKNEIANSFIFNPITHSRMTNGFIEGKNRYIDTLKWISFGFKDFDTLRYKIINYQNHNKK